MRVRKGRKLIKIGEIKKVGFFGKVRGLMFRRRESAKCLLFKFAKPSRIRIHSFFVFFSFLAVWLDGENRVVDLKIVRPFSPRVLPKASASQLLEIPLNRKNARLVRLLVDNEKDLNIEKN